MIIISPDEVERILKKWGLPLQFDATERASQPNTSTVVESFDRLFAFPTPTANSGLNILNLRRLLGVDPSHLPSFFDHPWYLEENFGTQNCMPGWHLLHMEVIPESLFQPHDYYSSVPRRNWILPSAIEVALMLFLHFERTGEQLLLKKHTWCSDEASLGRYVTVGAFGRNGLFISSHPPIFASRGLGVCGKRVDLLQI
jgi:hypothetical protein